MVTCRAKAFFFFAHGNVFYHEDTLAHAVCAARLQTAAAVRRAC